MREWKRYCSSLPGRLAKIALIWGMLTMVIGCSSSGQQTAAPSSPRVTPSRTATSQSRSPVQVNTRVIATGLEIPWGLSFLPDGRALVSERASGRLLAITASGQVQEVQRLPSYNIGEGGLLGITLSPNYATDGWVYAYYSTQTDNRIVRFHLKETPQPLLTGIPVAANHNGGRIAFGPDGMLYTGTGDATNKANAQNLTALGGKILRMTPDGGIPADNPFSGSLVYSYGHRNVQGLAWDTKGQLYASEFGQNTFDEVNRIMPGGNYGWPNAEGQGNDARFINPLLQRKPHPVVQRFSSREPFPSGKGHSS